jgi:hypothetical protein
MGDDLAAHLRRPLGQVLLAQKRGFQTHAAGHGWRTHHTEMGGPRRDAPVIIAAGFSPLFGPHDRYDTAEEIAQYARSWQRLLFVVASGTPGAAAIVAGAKAGGAAVCQLRPCPELEARAALAGPAPPLGAKRAPCAPSLATTAAWAAEVAHHLT